MVKRGTAGDRTRVIGERSAKLKAREDISLATKPNQANVFSKQDG